MVKITTKIYGGDTSERLFLNLPKKLNKAFEDTNKLFLMEVQKLAKMFAPVDTEALKESIKVSPVRKGKNVKVYQLVADPPYAKFQEEGFAPHSFFAGYYINSSKLSPMKSYHVSKWTPFIKPAFEIALGNYDFKIDKALKEVTK